jgi:predicted PurR-regulated permease PerM
MTLGEQARWWGLALLALVLFVWALSSAVTPFLAGMAIAYFLDPVADRLERLGLSRLAATCVITAGAVAVAAGVAMVFAPLMLDQFARSVRAAPDLLSAAQGRIENLLMGIAPQATAEGGMLATAFDQLEARVKEASVAIVGSVYSGGLALIDFLLLAVITPVVAFYMLLDWDRMVDEIDHWLPRTHAETIRRIACDVDRVLAGFVRGQLTVCLILGTFYAVALMLVGLNFGVLVGFFAGVISFVPFVGSLVGGALSIGIAAFQFWGDWTSIAAVAAIFLVGQAVEGNYLTPRLVGGSVGLHPVWLMFALSAFGAAMGFVGLLIAVPAAAVIGVLARFGLEQYRMGRLYAGGECILPDDPDHERDAEREAERAHDRARRAAE